MQGRKRVDRQLLDAQALVGHLVPAGSMFAFLAAHRGELFADEDFADLFPSGKGRPSVPASAAIGAGSSSLQGAGQGCVYPDCPVSLVFVSTDRAIP